VPLAGRLVLRFEDPPADFPQGAYDFIEGGAPTGADVENFSGNVWRLTGEQVGLDRVFNIGEIAGLLAIPEYDRLRFLEKRGAEVGEHAGVRRPRILPRPKNVEVAERNVFQAVAPTERLPVQLAHVLGNAVRRNGLRLHGLDFGKRGRFAVSRRGCGKYDT